MFLNYDHSVFVEIEFEEHYGFLKSPAPSIGKQNPIGVG